MRADSVAIPIPRVPKEPQHRESRGSALQQLSCVPRPSAGRSCPYDGVSASDCIWPGSPSTPSRHWCPAAWGQKLVREVPVVSAANPATKAGICRSGAGEAGFATCCLKKLQFLWPELVTPTPAPISISVTLAGSAHHS